MTYYLFFLFFLILTAFVLAYRNSKLEKAVAIFASVIIIILGTIRWKTGFDWIFYWGFYLYIRDYVEQWSDMKVSFEPLYTTFYFIAKYTGVGFVMVQFLQIFFITVLKYATFRKYTPYITLAIFFNFCFFPDIVTVRNFLAAAVVFYGLRFVTDRKPIPFLLTIIAASNIHVSSMICLLFYPIYYMRVSIGVKALALLLSVAVGFTGIFELFLSGLVENFLGGMGDTGNKLSYYAEDAAEGDGGSANIVIILLGIFRRLLIIPVIFYFEHKYFSKDKLFKGVSNLFIFGNIIYFVVGTELRIFQRMSIPFYLCEILLLVWIYAKVKLKPLFFTFLFLYGFSKYYYIYTDNYLVDPYITIFDYDTPQKRWDKHKPEKPFE